MMSLWKNLRVVKTGRPTQRSSPPARAIISEENDISDTSKSAKRSWRQNISDGCRTVATRSIPSGLTVPSRIGHDLGLEAMARLSLSFIIAFADRGSGTGGPRVILPTRAHFWRAGSFGQAPTVSRARRGMKRTPGRAYDTGPTRARNDALPTRDRIRLGVRSGTRLRRHELDAELPVGAMHDATAPAEDQGEFVGHGTQRVDGELGAARRQIADDAADRRSAVDRLHMRQILDLVTRAPAKLAETLGRRLK